MVPSAFSRNMNDWEADRRNKQIIIIINKIKLASAAMFLLTKDLSQNISECNLNVFDDKDQ